MTHGQQFEAFMKDYQNMVYSTAMRLLANETEAQDISQEVFLRAYERFDDLKDSNTSGGWLKTVTTNLCLNQLSRYRARWSFFSEIFSRNDDSGEEQQIDFPDESPREDAMEASERREVVESALRTLPQTQRVPLVLYHFEDMRYEDIAAKLGVSLGKVKTDIFRGREALRRKLQQRFQEELS